MEGYDLDNTNNGELGIQGTVSGKKVIGIQNIILPQDLLIHKINNYAEAVKYVNSNLEQLLKEKSSLDFYPQLAFMCFICAAFISFSMRFGYFDTIFIKLMFIFMLSGFGTIVYFGVKKYNRKCIDIDINGDKPTLYQRWQWLSHSIKANKELLVELYKLKITKDIYEKETTSQEPSV